MAHVSTYVYLKDTTETAFNFYRSVFGGEFMGAVERWVDAPAQNGMPTLPDRDKQLISHIALPILGGHVLEGSDAPESMGLTVTVGNNVRIALHPESKEDADMLFKRLSEGGTVETQLHYTFWGDYFGAFSDRYGVRWMVMYSP